MTEPECAAKLMNLNGGWFVVGNDKQHPIGYQFQWHGQPMVVVGTATEAEANADCAALGLPESIDRLYWHKCTTD